LLLINTYSICSEIRAFYTLSIRLIFASTIAVLLFIVFESQAEGVMSNKAFESWQADSSM
jgi:hypothetical protein